MSYRYNNHHCVKTNKILKGYAFSADIYLFINSVPLSKNIKTGTQRSNIKETKYYMCSCFIHLLIKNTFTD